MDEAALRARLEEAEHLFAKHMADGDPPDVVECVGCGYPGLAHGDVWALRYEHCGACFRREFLNEESYPDELALPALMREVA